MLFGLSAGCAEILRNDSIEIEQLTKDPQRYDNKKVSVNGFAVRDRHNLQIVQSEDSGVSVVLKIPGRAERSSSAQGFVEIVYGDSMTESWRDVHATFVGVFRWRPTEIPRYVLVVEEVRNLAKPGK